MITQDRLKQLFDYDAGTGEFRFLPRARSEFATDRAFSIFKTKCQGKVAGWGHVAGYISIRIDGRDYLAHRLAWLWMTGALPENEVDHVNGNRSDNRFSNLRSVSKLENSHNQSIRITNKSGHNGVFWDGRRRAWRVDLMNEGRSIYLGQFKTIEEATAARKAGERALGFNRGHGKPRQGEYYKRRRRSVSLPGAQASVHEEKQRAK